MFYFEPYIQKQVFKITVVLQKHYNTVGSRTVEIMFR